jgi:hypothetical protein
LVNLLFQLWQFLLHGEPDDFQNDGKIGVNVKVGQRRDVASRALDGLSDER